MRFNINDMANGLCHMSDIICCSFDHGQNMYLFPGTGLDEIKVFISGQHGVIAYLTENQKVSCTDILK